MRRVALALALVAAPAAAQELRPAPDYFVEAAMASSTAHQIAINCPSLSIDLGAIGRRSAEVLDRLTEDGFTPRILAEEMEDPGDAIAVLQADFLARHDLAEGAPANQVCAAGLAEIEAGSDIGAVLVEVAE